MTRIFAATGLPESSRTVPLTERALPGAAAQSTTPALSLLRGPLPAQASLISPAEATAAKTSRPQGGERGEEGEAADEAAVHRTVLLAWGRTRNRQHIRRPGTDLGDFSPAGTGGSRGRCG